jgi:hypothetical protein
VLPDLRAADQPDGDEAARAGASELDAEETDGERAPKRARLEAAAAGAMHAECGRQFA